MAASAFSYAQAAKGQSTSRRSSNVSAVQQSTEVPTEQKPEQPEPIKKPADVVDSSNDVAVSSTTTAPAQEQSIVNGVSPEKPVTKSIPTKKVDSRGSSPGATSITASNLKEDNVSATPAESESTWEKNSQRSRSTAKSDKGADNGKLATFEQVKTQMKEAAVPSVNPWHKRMEDARAKTAPKPVATKPERSQATMNGDAPVKRQSKNLALNSQSGSTEAVSQPKFQKPTQVTPAAVAAPPPATDAISWPTPYVGSHEEKKKEVEPTDTDKPASKPHGKEKWEKIPFVPTAIFNTPMPTRGGARGGRIGGRGGRDSVSRGGSISAAGLAPANRGTVLQNADTQAQSLPARPKARDGSPREGVTKQRRSGSAGSPRANAAESADGQARKTDIALPRTISNPGVAEQRRASTSTQTEGTVVNGHTGNFDGPKRVNSGHEVNGESRFPRAERPFQPRSRDTGAESASYFPPRDRGEGRPERGGRGSWRGKSGGTSHASYGANSHYQQAPAYANGVKPFSEQRHNSHPASYTVPRESRHSRTNSRSQSIPNSQPYGRYGMHNMQAPAGLPVLQTDMANGFVPQPAIMSAVPFNPYMEQVQLPQILQMQLEYYFSMENLIKDIFLRKHMDSQGFVFLHVLQNFRRIQNLTTDSNLVKMVCDRSPLLELQLGQDGVDRIRKAEDWEQWVMPMAERDPSVQNDGPEQLMTPRFETFPPMHGGFDMYAQVPHSNPMSPANGFMMNGFRPEPFHIDANGPRGHFNSGSAAQTPLSANVPDFRPAQGFQGQNSRVQNHVELEEKFVDASIDGLKISVASGIDQSSSKQSGTSDAVSNGHVKNGTHEENDGEKVNGVVESKVTGGSPPLKELKNLPNGFLGHKKRPSKTFQPRITWTANSEGSGESYIAFRARAMQERANTPFGQCPDAMVDLYEFWALFLAEKLHIKVYQDFHSTAMQDANEKQSLVGLRRLAEFYGKSLYSEDLVADRLLNDFVTLATIEIKMEQLPERPAFHQLRKAWRDGAINPANRHSLVKKLSEDLKAALDASP